MERKDEEIEGEQGVGTMYARQAVSFEMQEFFDLAEWALDTSTASRIGEPNSVWDRTLMKKSDR